MKDRSLYEGVKLLSLDAGNTIVFLDHRACADLAASALARSVDERAIERAEGVAKKRLDAKQLLPPLDDKEITPAWGAFMATLVQIATGVDDARAAECTRVLWAEHRRFNLWRKVPDGLVEAVGELRARGVPVAVVSNSEGQLQTLFDNLGIGDAFDLVVDSHHVGVEEPDPAIFAPVVARFGASPADGCISATRGRPMWSARARRECGSRSSIRTHTTTGSMPTCRASRASPPRVEPL